MKKSSTTPETTPHEAFFKQVRNLIFRKKVVWVSESEHPVEAVSLTKRDLVWKVRDSDKVTGRFLDYHYSNPDLRANLKALLALFVGEEPVITIQSKSWFGSNVTLYVLKRFGDRYVGFKTTMVQT